MRRLGAVLTAVLLIIALAGTVRAATGATSVNSFATVSPDGSCQISLSVTVHVEDAERKLYFPVPKAAGGVRLNGSRVSAPVDNGVRKVNLSRAIGKVTGDITVNIQYSLPDVITTTEEGILQLQLPLLSGFDYPVEQLAFSVTMPGEVAGLPGFISGYHQNAIEEDLQYTVEGATVSGSSLKAMKDHETLMLTMAVSEQMFPQSVVQTQSVEAVYVCMAVCAGLALLYWLFFLRSFPWGRIRTGEPPQGFTAGHMGCIMTMQGVDLTMTVFSWAQLGYILIQMEKRGRVLLHKRMDMGNERSEHERRVFQKLFGGKQTVDTGSLRYAQLSRTLQKNPAMVQELVNRRSGNSQVFRVLASGIGLFGGVGLGLCLGSGAVLQVLLILLLGTLGGISGYYMITWCAGVRLRYKKNLYMSLIAAGIWLLLGLLAGAFTLSLWLAGGLFAAGLLYSWSGRRTDFGRQTVSQVMGLRRYLVKPDKKHIAQLQQADPAYFFRMAPYALAFGVERPFSQAFGSIRPDKCPYLVWGGEGNMTASQWCAVMQRIVAAMDERADKLPLERLLTLIHSITKGY